MKSLFTIFSSSVFHPLEKCSLLIFAVLTFTASQTIAEFGPQQIVTSTATDVMDAFPADMDGDGDIDILATKPGNPFFGGGAAVLYRNNGNGSFTELTPFTNGPTTLVSNIVASDLDNDGDLDVVLGSSGTRSGGVRVYRNNGSLRFTRTFDNENAPYLWDIHLGDVNKDNRPDIIFGLGGSFDQIGIYLNSGNMFNWGGLIAAKTGTSTGDEPRNIHLADIDGDGDQDVISANYLSNQISYYPNGGGVSVVRLTSSSQTRGPRNVRTGDINGDGRLDLISVSVLDGKVAWYNGTGNGRFGSQKIIHTYSTRSTGGGPDGSDALGPRGLDVADFDGDGDLDVFSTSEVGSTVCLHENLGGGSFGQAEIITNRANGVNLVTTIDMDGDGDLDVVSSSPGDNKIAWYETIIEQVPSFLSYTSNGNSITITDCDASKSGELIIPSTIEGKLVTKIGSEAFKDCSNLTSIIIPDSVTTIGEYAFVSCSKLSNITIPNSVTSIGGWAFVSCTSLTSINIPDTVRSIGYACFDNCTSLTSIIIPNGITTIEGGVFANCTALTSIAIPNSVTSIGNATFSSCTALVSISIPNSVKSIGDNAFNRCSSLKSITIPDSITSIESSTFLRCTSLTSITIPNGVTSIGANAFDFCTSLTSISIPDTVISIGNAAFFSCANITSITIPDSVTRIGDKAFSGCYELQDFIFLGNAPILGEDVFESAVDRGKITISSNAEGYGETFGGVSVEIKPDSDSQIIANLQSQITTLQNQINQLSQRPTLEQLQDARASSIIINSNDGEITLKFDIEESENLTLWQKTGESISKTIQLKDGKKFYRFAIDS